MQASGPSTFTLVLTLAAFLVAGSAMALFVWHTLSDFLAGRPVDGGAYLLAVGLLVVFIGFAAVLGRTVRRVTGAR